MNETTKKCSDAINGVTCFAIQAKYGVSCQRRSCTNWFNNKPTYNCVLIAAQDGPRTLQEVGQLYQLTRMRICQIEKKIYKKIHSSITE